MTKDQCTCQYRKHPQHTGRVVFRDTACPIHGNKPLPVASVPQATPFCDEHQQSAMAVGGVNKVLLVEDACTLERAKLAAEAKRDSLSAQLVQAKALLLACQTAYLKTGVEITTETHAFVRKIDQFLESPTPPTPTLYCQTCGTPIPIGRDKCVDLNCRTAKWPFLFCQTCGHGQTFGGDTFPADLKMEGECDVCCKSRTFGPEKPEGKQP